jgi:hypothetical protein
MANETLFVNSYKKRVLDGDIDLGNDTIKAMLLDSSHTTNIDTQEFIDDVSANEVAASGSYAAGGITLSITTSQDDTDDEGVADATDFSATTATISADYICYYKDTGTPGTSPIIAIEDLNGTKTSTAGTWAYTVAAEGLINVN